LKPVATQRFNVLHPIEDPIEMVEPDFQCGTTKHRPEFADGAAPPCDKIPTSLMVGENP